MKINITKRFLLSLCLMTLTLLCGENKAWASDVTVTSTFKDKNWSVGDGEPSWTSSGAATYKFESRGVQILLKNIKASGLKLSNSSIKKLGNIKSITLTVSATGTGGKISSVNVGSTSFLNNGSSSYTVAKNSQTVTFKTDTPIAGNIVISFSTKATSNSLYIKSIAVTYEEVASTPAPTFSLTGGTYYGERSVSISVDGTGSILYTTNGDDPKTKGNAYTGAISLPVGTKNLTLKAVAKYGEGLFSDVTEATYDIQKAPSTFYQRITSADELTENGSYLIVCESESVAFGEINSSDKGTPQAVTITDDKIYLSAAGTGTPTEFILEVSGSNYKLKNASTGEYINVTASSTDITETASGTALNIEINSDNTANIEIATQGSTPRQILYKISTTSFGNYASSNLTNPQNKADYGTVYLYKKHVISDFTFSDTEDLTASLPKTSPLADQTVTLDRKVYSGWNTFCVPFALTQAQLEEAYGSGAVAKYLSNVTTDGAAATLHFTPEEKGGIKANKAYLLYLTADVTEAKTFSGVTLQPAGDCTTTVSAAGGNYSFKGILKPTKLTTTDTQYFLNSAGTDFVLPINNTNAMKATRAYIIVPDAPGSAQSRQYSFDFNGTTTGIDNVNISGLEDGGAWYTISGIRVNRPAAKGVYIHNGRKVIVK